MPATTDRLQPTTFPPILLVAFELGAKEWKLGFTTGPGRAPRLRRIAAGNLAALEREIEAAKRRFELSAEAEVISCYEAGRDGFWLHRYLVSRGIRNHVVDSSSIEVSRRKRRRKSDQLDLRSLLRLLGRHVGGEDGVWSVVNVPSPEAEDRRQLHREIATLTEERKERTNRIKSLLATQGVRMKLTRDFRERLRQVRLWNGSELPGELRARLEREWVRRQRVTDEMEALGADRLKRLRTVKDDPALEQVRGLMQLRGLGIKSSWLFVMEFFSWRDFGNRREVGALAGLAPTPNQRGEEDQSPGIEKAGNVWVRTMATEIAWSWIRNQPDSEITRWFERRFANAGKRARRRGITAVARKVLVALWRYLDHGVIPMECLVYRGPDDRYQGREICLRSGGQRFVISDVTDKANPVQLANVSHPNPAYMHQGWTTDDHRYHIMDDESDLNRGFVETTRTLVWDLSDLEDPTLALGFRASLPASAHNLYIKDDLMYQANYRYGLHIIDITDPLDPEEVGFFDTAPYLSGPGFSGACSDYAFFESGTVIVPLSTARLTTRLIHSRTVEFIYPDGFHSE